MENSKIPLLNRRRRERIPQKKWVMGPQQVNWKKIVFTGGVNFTASTEISWKLGKSKELGCNDFNV
jgi:hypothetical protein